MIYEIESENRKKESIGKKVEEIWCRDNGYRIFYITEEWIINNCHANLLDSQPERIRYQEGLKR
jgi:hypothetical protein